MRVQLALNVADLDAAVDYYAKLFGAPPSKRRPGYANFALDRPPLKLVLLEVPDAPERLNHLGVELFEQDALDAAIERLSAAGIAGEIEVDRTCCYARQDKVWSSDPQGARWEFYRVLGDTERFAEPAPPECGAAGPDSETAPSAETCGACG